MLDQYLGYQYLVDSVFLRYVFSSHHWHSLSSNDADAVVVRVRVRRSRSSDYAELGHFTVKFSEDGKVV